MVSENTLKMYWKVFSTKYSQSALSRSSRTIEQFWVIQNL